METRRLCSSRNDFNSRISNLKDCFLARDYPQKVIKEQIYKVVFGEQPIRKDTSKQGVPFVATCYPKLKDLGKLIKNLQLFLYGDSKLKRVFSPTPMVSYRKLGKQRTA